MLFGRCFFRTVWNCGVWGAADLFGVPVEILLCKRSERFVLTFFQKPLDNLFGLCYNTSCSVERSTDGNAALAQLDRVPGYEPVGRGFESLMPRHGALADAGAFLLCFSEGGSPILSGGPPQIIQLPATAKRSDPK